jgi:hypothetical protein
MEGSVSNVLGQRRIGLFKWFGTCLILGLICSGETVELQESPCCRFRLFEFRAVAYVFCFANVPGWTFSPGGEDWMRQRIPSPESRMHHAVAKLEEASLNV